MNTHEESGRLAPVAAATTTKNQVVIAKPRGTRRYGYRRRTPEVSPRPRPVAPIFSRWDRLRRCPVAVFVSGLPTPAWAGDTELAMSEENVEVVRRIYRSWAPGSSPTE